jgi:intracellular multiplication protein IcmT
MAILKVISHWRDSGRLPRFFIIDARSAFPLLLFLIHIKWWTFFVALAITLFFAVIEHYGLSTTVFFRSVRTILAGKVKTSKPWWRRKHLY